MARRPKDNRGGKRTPAKPAAVSGPGASSARTDGAYGKNPSNAEQIRQPVRPIPAESHGDRQELSNLQSSAPMAAAPQTTLGVSPAPTVGGNGGTPNPAGPGGMNLPFDPFSNEGDSELGGEDYTEDDMFMDDVDMWMSTAFEKVSHPDLFNLMTQRSMRGGF